MFTLSFMSYVSIKDNEAVPAILINIICFKKILMGLGKLQDILQKMYNSYLKRSTITNLACVTQFICGNLDVEGQVDIVYTDI